MFDTAITWTTDGANAGTVSYRSGRFYSTNVNGVLISDKGYANKAISEILNLEAWKWVSHVGNPKLMNNVMGDISIMIPSSFEEQDRLSDFLNQLDDTITLHEEKKRQLERLKSALMQKMFADKSGYPAVRFYGFSDKWEKRKLGDIFEERIEKSHNGSEELLSVTLKDGVVKAESLDRKNNASHDKRNYKLVFPNDIAYNSMRMWQGALGVSKYNGIVSPAYTIIKLKNQLENPCFYQNYFKKYEILNVFRKSSQGLTSDTWNLKYPLFSRIHLFTTSSAEQQNISSLLTLLDYNIALHGYKLELLKKIKKFLLQSMFI